MIKAKLKGELMLLLSELRLLVVEYEFSDNQTEAQYFRDKIVHLYEVIDLIDGLMEDAEESS